MRTQWRGVFLCFILALCTAVLGGSASAVAAPAFTITSVAPDVVLAPGDRVNLSVNMAVTPAEGYDGSSVSVWVEATVNGKLIKSDVQSRSPQPAVPHSREADCGGGRQNVGNRRSAPCSQTGRTSSPRRSKSQAEYRTPASGPNNPAPLQSVPRAARSIAQCPFRHHNRTCLVPATPGLGDGLARNAWPFAPNVDCSALEVTGKSLEDVRPAT